MLVKICGITNIVDAKIALDAGADWIGLNLVGGPRRIDLPAACRILAALPDPACAVVLLSVTTSHLPTETVVKLRDMGVERLQLYGQVSPYVVGEAHHRGLETIFVQPVHDHDPLGELDDFLTRCGDRPPQYVLFDASVPGRQGGTGQQANWDVLADARTEGRFDRWPPVLLAGGLLPGNVNGALGIVSPIGVDVSSGVESIPGRKDRAKVQAFVEAVHSHRI